MTEPSDQEKQLPFFMENPLVSPSLWFYTTNQCNINCKYCFNYIEKNHEHMSAELAVAILKKCIEHQHASNITHPYIHLLLFGGEPTLNPEPIFSLLDYADAHRIKIMPHLLTNGIMKESVLNTLIEKKMFFQVSFDGYQNNLRLGNNESTDLNKIIIKTLEKISSHQEIPLTIRATIHAGNIDSMEEILKLSLQFNTNRLIFQPTFAEGNALKYSVQQPDIQKFISNFQKVKSKGKELNIPVSCPLEKTSSPSNRDQSYLPLVWLPDGSLSFTIRYASTKASGASQAIIGKYDSKSQEILLDEQRLKSMQSDFLQARAQYCQGCSIYENCLGKNNFDPYTLNKSTNIGDYYLCEISRLLSLN